MDGLLEESREKADILERVQGARVAFPEWAVDTNVENAVRKLNRLSNNFVIPLSVDNHYECQRIAICLVVAELGGFLAGLLIPATGNEVNTKARLVVLALLQPFTLVILVGQLRCVQSTSFACFVRTQQLKVLGRQTSFPCWLAITNLFTVCSIVGMQNYSMSCGAFLATDHLPWLSTMVVSILWFLATFSGIFFTSLSSYRLNSNDTDEEASQTVRYGYATPVTRLMTWALEWFDLRVAASNYNGLRTNHFEAEIKYSIVCGLSCISCLTTEYPMAVIRDSWFLVHNFETTCIDWGLVLARMNCMYHILSTFSRAFPQLVVQVYIIHKTLENPSELVFPYLMVAVSCLNIVCNNAMSFYSFHKVYADLNARLEVLQLHSLYEPKEENNIFFMRLYYWTALAFVTFVGAGSLASTATLLLDLSCKDGYFSIAKARCFNTRNAKPESADWEPIAIGMAAAIVAVMLVLRVLHQPALPRESGAKLYVDEDLIQYFLHVPGSKEVTSCADGSTHDGFEVEEAHVSFLRTPAACKTDRNDLFEDAKLLRVQERAEQNDMPMLDRERELYLRLRATRADWFELAYRFGKEVEPSVWCCSNQFLHSRKRIIKLMGFDGGSKISCPLMDAAQQQLDADADIVVWDGDWYNEAGWTKLIASFLEASKEKLAVAYQKRAEVPGFHRSYWHLYQRFPGRISIVVLSDEDYEESRLVHSQLVWLREQMQTGFIQEPRSWTGSADRYLKLALISQQMQGRISGVIAFNGGRITTAQAAVQTLFDNDGAGVGFKWTVYDATRIITDSTGTPLARQEETGTLVDFAKQNPRDNLVLKLSGSKPERRAARLLTSI